MAALLAITVRATLTCQAEQRTATIAPPISLRLDEDIRAELAAQAGARGVGLSTLLRDIAADAARAARRPRIRNASDLVGRHVQTAADAAAFYDTWGTPGADAG